MSIKHVLPLEGWFARYIDYAGGENLTHYTKALCLVIEDDGDSFVIDSELDNLTCSLEYLPQETRTNFTQREDNND